MAFVIYRGFLGVPGTKNVMIQACFWAKKDTFQEKKVYDTF
jgi:hypothetical protein